MRTCTHCAEQKPATEFYGVKRRCKPCYRAHQNGVHQDLDAARRADRLEKQLAYQKTDAGRAAARRARLKHRYGITEAQYDVMLAAQGGTCALCPAEISQDGRRLAVDHDHETGVVRGVLCLRCNNQIALVDRLGIDALKDYIARGRVHS